MYLNKKLKSFLNKKINLVFCILSGGVGESYKLKEAPEDLFGIMLKACNRVSMMSCSIDSGEGGGESRYELLNCMATVSISQTVLKYQIE